MLAVLLSVGKQGHAENGEEFEPAIVDYKLGPQDKLRIFVHEWPLLAGEFTVGANGALSLPLVGEVRAVGLRPSEIATRLADTLRAKKDLSSLPEISVEVVQYRPFYIMGQVDKPGEYQFRPGMSVLSAVSIAGGMYRMTELGSWTFTRDVSQLKTEQTLLELKREELLVKEIRLMAEAAGSDKVSFSSLRSLVPEERLPELESREREVFEANRESVRRESKALLGSIALLEGEVEEINRQLASEKKQLRLFEDELNQHKGRLQRGLATRNRTLELEQARATYERNLSELERKLIEARQRIATAERENNKIIRERRNAATGELQTVRALQDENQKRRQASRNLADKVQPMQSGGQDRANAVYSIVRTTGRTQREFPASESTTIEPGDIVHVRIENRQSDETALTR